MAQAKWTKLLSGILALGVWELAARLIHNRLLLAGPIWVFLRLLGLLPTSEFWQTIGFTFSRITLGFLLAWVLALLLAALAARLPVVEVLIHPYMAAVQTVPVASFIVIAILWLSGRRLSVFISFLMVLPVLYASLLQGIRSADVQLLEMARVYRMPLWNRLRCIYVPAVEPYAQASSRSALGLCWKAGVAAEVIGVCRGSIGGMLYDAKLYLEIEDLFAWTLVIVLLSFLFERSFLWLLGKAFRILEGS